MSSVYLLYHLDQSHVVSVMVDLGHQTVGIFGRDGIIHIRRRGVSDGGGENDDVKRKEALIFWLYSIVNIYIEN